MIPVDPRRLRQLPAAADDRRAGRRLPAAQPRSATTSTSSARASCSWRMLDGGVDTGWTFYTPYSTHDADGGGADRPRHLHRRLLDDRHGINFIVTVHTMRAPGLTWMRLPLFVWAHLRHEHHPGAGDAGARHRRSCSSRIDHAFDWGLFDPARGGDPVLYPAPLLVLLAPRRLHHDPAGDGRRERGRPDLRAQEPVRYKAIAYSTLGIAFVGFLTWGHHMFVAGMSTFDAGAFGVLSMLVAIFTAIKVFTWVGTHVPRRRSPFATPLLYVFALPLPLRLRRHDRRRRGHDEPRRALARHLLRRRAFPLHHGRRHAHGVPRRAALLVPEDDRAHVPRAAGARRRGARRSSASSPRSFRSSCSATPGCRGATTTTRRSSRRCTWPRRRAPRCWASASSSSSST